MPFPDYLIHQIEIVRGRTGEAGTGSGMDEWGRPVEAGDGAGATPEVLLCDVRVEWDTKLVLNSRGQEVVATGPIFVPAVWILDGVIQENEFGPRVLHIGPQDIIIFEGREYHCIVRNRCESDMEHREWGSDIDRQHWEIWVA